MNAIRLTVFAALLVTQSPVAQETDSVSGASPFAHGDPQVRERITNWLQDELALSIEQQAVLADIMRDYGPRLAAITRQGMQVGWSLMDVAPKNPQYAVETEAAAQAAAEAAAEWVRTATEMRNAIYSILSAEQIARIESELTARREAWRARHNKSQQESADAAD